MVIGQTFGVKLVMKLRYLAKFELVLIPLIVIMMLFPFIV